VRIWDAAAPSDRCFARRRPLPSGANEAGHPKHLYIAYARSPLRWMCEIS
jgi:hypothetical protein